jgi:glycosyltransferase involved in cell wall biosynthesis
MINTDADNQYPSRYMEKLIQPIREGRADIVIGNRRVREVDHFSPVKKLLQRSGSAFVRLVTKTDIPDTVSGFRAFSREALLKINIHARYSYVLDTLMQCSHKHLRVESVDISINRPTRKSRLFRNYFHYIHKTLMSLLKIYIIYRPVKFFLQLAFLFLLPALFISGRFLYFFFFTNEGGGHIQSLIAAAILITGSFAMVILGVIGNLMQTNRELLEENLYLQKKDYYRK